MDSLPPYTSKEIDAVFGMLVSPSYRLKNEWLAYLQKRYANASDERLYFFDMMEIGAMIVKRYRNRRHKTLRLFFEQLDGLLQQSDPEVINLLSAGLIEGIQQICAYDERIDMRYDFDPWLLPHTKPVWDELAYGFYSTLFAERDRMPGRSRKNKRS